MNCLLMLKSPWLRYRLNEEKAEWIVYVTDVGQQQHFSMFFKVWLMNIFFIVFDVSCLKLSVVTVVMSCYYESGCQKGRLASRE